MIESDELIKAERLDFIKKNVGKAAVSFGKKVANNPVRALEIASKIGTSKGTENAAKVLSPTPDLIKFATTGDGIMFVQKDRGLYLGTKRK